MADPVSTSLAVSLLIKGVESAYGEPIGALSTHLVQKTFKSFAARLPKILSSPENHDLLRAVRKSYLNAALVVCFARLKILNPSRWRSRVLQVLPGSEDEDVFFNRLEKQFLDYDKTIHAEVKWLFRACKEFKRKLAETDDWKPDAIFEEATKSADLLLKPEAAQTEVDRLNDSLGDSLISEFAETAFFERWDENSTAPKPSDRIERHKQCLPPELLKMILDGWLESVESPNQAAGTSPLGLSGETTEFKWFDVMCAFFAEEIKRDEAVRSIMQTQLLVDLKYRRDGGEADLTVEVFRNELAKANLPTTNRLEAIESEVRGLGTGQIEIKNKLDSLLPLLVSLENVSLVVRSLPELIRQEGQQTRAEVEQAKDEIIVEVHKIKQPPPLPKTLRQAEGFVGRVDYLDKLREAYRAGTRKFVLHGLGGVGKTALALKFADEIAENYPAQAQIEMLGMSEQPLDSRKAMFEIIRQFGQEIAPDASDEAVRNTYASLVQNQPTLIVLDNAKDLRAVKDLAPYDVCLLVTSREEFNLAGGKSEKIKQMSEPDARKLLYSIAPENLYGGRADELARLAGHLPMALKPLAALVRDNDETIGELIARYERQIEHFFQLQDVDHDDLTIFASFELSYQNLPADLRERWRRLAVFPADFDRDGAAAVWETTNDNEKTIESLKRLRQSNLLDRDDETKRYSLHDTARKYALTKLSDEEKFNAGRLHAAHYVKILIEAQEIQFSKTKDCFLRGLKLVDGEWSNINAGQQWAADNITDKEAAVLCTDYAGFARDFVKLRQHPRANIKWLETSLNAARSLGDRQSEGNNLGNLGLAYDSLGDYKKAIDYHEQSLQISREIGNRFGEGASLGNLGIAYDSLGDYRKAIEYHEQSLQISREIGNRFGEGTSLGSLGNAYHSLGDYRKAIKYHEQSLQIAREIGDRLGEGQSLGNLGIAYHNLGDYRKAIEYHEQYLQISREIGDRLGEGTSSGNLGNAYDSLGEIEMACGLWREALAIFEAIESPHANIFRRLLEENCRS